MELLKFLVIGLAAGWVMGKLRRGKGYGLLGNLVVGVIGSFVGGFVFGLLNIPGDNGVISFLMAVVGALVFFLIWDAVRPKTRRKSSDDDEDDA